MDFTREPIIETIVTPRDGYKIVIRSSKGATQEEYFLESVQIVSYGNAFFFRSTELPKSFLVPVSDYELVEVRETRVALKSAVPDRAIKIGGGREAPLRSTRETVGREAPIRESLREPAREPIREPMREPVREPVREPMREPVREPVREPAYTYNKEMLRPELRPEMSEKAPVVETRPLPPVVPMMPLDSRHDKKRDRRRPLRRRRPDLPEEEEGEELPVPTGETGPAPVPAPAPIYLPEKREFSTSLTSILPHPLS